MYEITTHELDGSIVRYDLVGLPPDAVAENAEQVGMEEVVAAVEANAIKPARPTSRSPVFTRGKTARMSTEAAHGSPDTGAGVLEPAGYAAEQEREEAALAAARDAVAGMAETQEELEALAKAEARAQMEDIRMAEARAAAMRPASPCAEGAPEAEDEGLDAGEAASPRLYLDRMESPPSRGTEPDDASAAEAAQAADASEEGGAQGEEGGGEAEANGEGEGEADEEDEEGDVHQEEGEEEEGEEGDKGGQQRARKRRSKDKFKIFDDKGLFDPIQVLSLALILFVL